MSATDKRAEGENHVLFSWTARGYEQVGWLLHDVVR
jgi:hypothetical protein